METWKHVWKVIAEMLSRKGLEALRDGLRHRDPRLIAGATTKPAPLERNADLAIEAGDPIAYALWHGQELVTVGQVEQAWFTTCHWANVALGDPCGVRSFLHWWDDSTEEARRAGLLLEVELALKARATKNNKNNSKIVATIA